MIINLGLILLRIHASKGKYKFSKLSSLFNFFGSPSKSACSLYLYPQALFLVVDYHNGSQEILVSSGVQSAVLIMKLYLGDMNHCSSRSFSNKCGQWHKRTINAKVPQTLLSIWPYIIMHQFEDVEPSKQLLHRHWTAWMCLAKRPYIIMHQSEDVGPFPTVSCVE